MPWTLYAFEIQCGHCGDPVPPEQPVYVAAGRFKRCRDCAGKHHGRTVDDVEIDAARHRLEAERARGPEPTVANTRPTFRPRSLRRLGDLAGAALDKRLPSGDRD